MNVKKEFGEGSEVPHEILKIGGNLCCITLSRIRFLCKL